jgi:hypothetical protein
MTTIVRHVRRLRTGPAAAVLALAALAALSLPGGAAAAPTITGFKATVVPIPGFPGTGDHLGAGAEIDGEAKVLGSEYDGAPPPLIEGKVFGPAGLVLHPQGFVTCAATVLEQTGPSACPKKSIAGPKGFGVGVVSFAGERVQERASVQPFFAPGGSLEAFVEGSTPVSLEIVAVANIVKASAPFGLEFSAQIPLIETVPGALDASFIEGGLNVGAAYRRGRKTISYITLPRKCTPGGWPAKLELRFYGGASARASFSMPCPRS